MKKRAVYQYRVLIKSFARLASAGLLLVLNNGCSSTVSDDAKTAESQKAPAPAPAGIRVAVARYESISPRIQAIGNVRARRVSIVASASDGIVEQMGAPDPSLPHGAGVDEGDFVTAGSVLSQLRLKSADLEIQENRALLSEKEATLAEAINPRQEEVAEALARLQAAEAILKMVERQAGELQKLLKNSAVGESQVRDAVDQLAEAQQNHAAAKAAYERIRAGASKEQRQQVESRRDAQQAHVLFLEEEKEKRTTRAPFDGVIVETHAEVGQWLAKGSPVVTIADLSSVEVEVQVDQTLIDQVSPGKAVTIRIPGAEPSAGTPGARWTGLVAAVVPKSDWQNGSRSFPVIVRINNEFETTPEGKQYRLKEGMMAEVEFEGTPIDGLLVPKDALVRSADELYLFALNPETPGEGLSVRRLVITTGVSKDGWIEVRGTDLKAGDRVVSQGGERLRPFQPVAIIPDEKQAPAPAPETAPESTPANNKPTDNK